jgi:hypothetical protein
MEGPERELQVGSCSLEGTLCLGHWLVVLQHALDSESLLSALAPLGSGGNIAEVSIVGLACGGVITVTLFSIAIYIYCNNKIIINNNNIVTQFPIARVCVRW